MEKFLNELLKPILKWEDLKYFILGEIVPDLKRTEDTKADYSNDDYVEAIGSVLDDIAKKYKGQLVLFEIVQNEILKADFVEKCDYTIENDRSSPDFDGDDTETEEVDFGENLKELVKEGTFKKRCEDWFEHASITNIQF